MPLSKFLATEYLSFEYTLVSSIPILLTNFIDIIDATPAVFKIMLLISPVVIGWSIWKFSILKYFLSPALIF